MPARDAGNGGEGQRAATGWTLFFTGLKAMGGVLSAWSETERDAPIDDDEDTWEAPQEAPQPVTVRPELSAPVTFTFTPADESAAGSLDAGTDATPVEEGTPTSEAGYHRRRCRMCGAALTSRDGRIRYCSIGCREAGRAVGPWFRS